MKFALSRKSASPTLTSVVNTDIERFVPTGPPVQRIALEHLVRYRFAGQLAAGASVLDLACGEGYGTEILAKAGAAPCWGVDINGETVLRARKRYGGSGAGFALGDARTLPFADATFDLIICLEFIEHIRHPTEILAECRRILKPDGVALISTPNRLMTAKKSKYHITEYSCAQFKKLLAASFPEALLLTQQSTASSELGSETITPGSPAELENAEYFVAVCGDHPDARIGKSQVVSSRLADVERGFQRSSEHNLKVLKRVTSDRDNLGQLATHQKQLLQGLEEDRGNLKSELASQSKLYRSVAADRDNLVRLLAEHKEQLAGVAADRDNLDRSLAEHREHLAGVKADRDNLRQEFEHRAESQQAVEADRDNLRQELERRAELEQAVEADRDNLRREMERQGELQQGVEVDRANLRELAEEQARQLERASEQIASLGQDCQDLERAAQERRQRIAELDGELAVVLGSRSWKLLKKLGIAKR